MEFYFWLAMAWQVCLLLCVWIEEPRRKRELFGYVAFAPVLFVVFVIFIFMDLAERRRNLGDYEEFDNED